MYLQIIPPYHFILIDLIFMWLSQRFDTRNFNNANLS